MVLNICCLCRLHSLLGSYGDKKVKVGLLSGSLSKAERADVVKRFSNFKLDV